MILRLVPRTAEDTDMPEEIGDCALCGLPTESRIEFDVEEVPWVTLVCVKGHWVVAPVADVV